MMPTPGEFTKRANDAFVAAVDLKTWPIQPGETVVASNARGSLAVLVEDDAGADVTASIIEGAPWVAASTQVAFWLINGAAPGRYRLEVFAPTSDGEMLTAVTYLTAIP